MFEAFLKYGVYSFVFLKQSTLISVRGLCTSVISLDYKDYISYTYHHLTIIGKKAYRKKRHENLGDIKWLKNFKKKEKNCWA